MSRRRIITAVAGLTVVAAAAPALAFWSASATATSSASATSVQAPSSVTAVAVSSTSIQVSVASLPTTGLIPTAFRVQRSGTTVSGCASLAVNDTCTESGLNAGTAYSYDVFGLIGANWVSSGHASASATTTAAPALTSITASSSSIASGSTASWTVVFSQPVSGVSKSNFVVTQTTGSAGATVASASASGGTTPNTTWTVASNAVTGSGSIRLDLDNKTGIQDSAGTGLSTTVPASGGSSATVTVTAAANHGFTILGLPASTTAGASYPITITSGDTGYSGSKTLTWTGGQTIGSSPAYPDSLPTAVTFTAGVANTSVTFYKAGSRSLTVKDSSDATYAGVATTSVSAATVPLSLTCPTSAARRSEQSITLSRPSGDAYGNSTVSAAVTAGVTATNVGAGDSQSVTIAANTLSQSFKISIGTSNGNGSDTVVSTTAPSGYAAAQSCSISHT